jgi:hypothetical protein
VKLARLRRLKEATYSSSYVNCRPKINAAISWDMGHTKGRLCKGGIGQGKEIKTLKLHRNKYKNFKILNWLGP